MAVSIILADTSILIDYFRKTDKANSKLVQLYDQGYEFSISGITHYEVYSGATQVQIPFWKIFLNKTKIFPFDEYVSQKAVEINNTLKQQRN